MTSTPLKAIGKLMGNRDHTTVLHGVEKISKEIETSDDLKNTIDIIKKETESKLDGRKSIVFYLCTK